jgi:hypothetical protein
LVNVTQDRTYTAGAVVRVQHIDVVLFVGVLDMVKESMVYLFYFFKDTRVFARNYAIVSESIFLNKVMDLLAAVDSCYLDMKKHLSVDVLASVVTEIVVCTLPCVEKVKHFLQNHWL